MADDIGSKAEKAGLGREFAGQFMLGDVLRAPIVLEKSLVNQSNLSVARPMPILRDKSPLESAKLG